MLKTCSRAIRIAFLRIMLADTKRHMAQIRSAQSSARQKHYELANAEQRYRTELVLLEADRQAARR